MVPSIIPVSICENPIQNARHHNTKVVTSLSVVTCEDKVNKNWKENECKQ